MRAIATVGLIVGLWAVDAGAAAINNSHSNIKNLLSKSNVTSASTNLTGPSDTQTVYTTAATGDFIVTTFCSSVVAGGVQLAAAGFAAVAQTGIGASCTTFTPGVSVPANTALTCTTGSGASPGTVYFCSLSGLQTLK